MVDPKEDMSVAIATIVLCGPDARSIQPVIEAVQKLAPFSEDENAVRITAFSLARDAMSVLDAVEALVYNRTLDGFEKNDCLKELVQLDTWEQCLAKFAEWDLKYDKGELTDARDREGAR
jgi:hypothetical protein